MHYKFPEGEYVWYAKRPHYPTETKRYDVDKGSIYKALAQIASEDKLPFSKLLARLQKETVKETRGTHAEREKWEEKFNRFYTDNGLITVQKARSVGYYNYGDREDIYIGQLQDYWYTVLGIARKPEFVPVCEPERLILFL
jgi:hypothetical protein